ncbi:MAG: DUF4339 domain-containing protein [Planctomycetaceae bacterium]|nr:DUF4339 domain-containing protein [Planctomycetaceae bacterium]
MAAEQDQVMAIQWYYRVDGMEGGPVTSSELRRLVANRQLGPGDFVKTSERPEWIEARNVKGLFAEDQLPAVIPSATVAHRPNPPPLPPQPDVASNAQQRLKGLFGSVKDKFKKATSSGKICGLCGKELGLLAWDHLPTVPVAFRGDHQAACAECVTQLEIICSHCDERWHVDPARNIKSCPSCALRTERESWIKSEYDQFRRTTYFEMPICQFGGGMFSAYKYDLHLTKMLHDEGSVCYCVDLMMKNTGSDLVYNDVTSLYFRTGQRVVRLEPSFGRRDSSFYTNDHGTKWTMVEFQRSSISPIDLLSLTEETEDILIRIASEGRGDIDLSMSRAEVGHRFTFFCERLGVRADSSCAAAIPNETVLSGGSQQLPATTGKSSKPEVLPLAESLSGTVVQALKQLKELLDAGILTQAEFDSKKAELLKRL